MAALLTWILPAGQFDRRDDAATGRRVVVAGTYHPVDSSHVGLFAAVVAIPRGFIAAADVIGLVLLVGGAWVVVDRLGTLPAVVAALVRSFASRGLWVIPIVSLFFGSMGALENMQEEIIPLVPVLLALGKGIVDAVSVVAMSAGAAMVGERSDQRIRFRQASRSSSRSCRRSAGAVCACRCSSSAWRCGSA